MNCEDIAINFLVSHITRKPPIKVLSSNLRHTQKKDKLDRSIQLSFCITKHLAIHNSYFILFYFY